MPKIYTKKGDKGMTSNFKGEKFSKSDTEFNLLGNLDELNAAIGICDFKNYHIHQLEIQHNLFDIGAHITTRGTYPFEKDTLKLESEIDVIQKDLPKLRNFILPNNNIHLARTICRRAERSAVKYGADEIILKYMNRLSDYLFVVARYVSHESDIGEIMYIRKS